MYINIYISGYIDIINCTICTTHVLPKRGNTDLNIRNHMRLGFNILENFEAC
jgi:hypothetical protein